MAAARKVKREPTPFRRGLAAFLCVQPVFWMSQVALAQTLEEQQQMLRQDNPPGVPSTQPSPGAPSAAPYGPSFGPSSGISGAPLFGAPSNPFPSFPPTPTPAESEPARAERPLLPVTPLSAPAVDEPLDPDRYICGPGDVLELNLWGVQNIKLRVTIDLEGRAFVPKIGYLALQGKTLSEVRRILRESVARYFPGLNFGVSLAEPRTFRVQVVDDVSHPGSYEAKAIDRVAALIGRAGGFGPHASLRRVEIQRRDGTAIRADLLLYALTGDVKHNPYLLDGDVVQVPFENVVASIGGGVNRPGRYELVGTSDLAELVDLAGGLSPGSTRVLPVSLVRRGADDRLQQTLYDFTPQGELPAIPLRRDDGVWIPNASDVQQSVTVVGAIFGATVTATGTTPDEVSATRRLPYAQGDTVRTLLEKVGGVGPTADLKGAYIMRRGEVVPVDLYTLVVLRDNKADCAIELGDTFVVPFQRRNILVEGAVFKPGPYPYNPSYGVEQYLALAGGLNRFAQDIGDVYVVNPKGETKEYAPDLKVEPGSSVIAPERSFSRSEIVGIIISAVGVLLAGVGIIITARK